MRLRRMGHPIVWGETRKGNPPYRKIAKEWGTRGERLKGKGFRGLGGRATILWSLELMDLEV
jgi:hypothetical protein